jgi:hypothetical protein
MNQATIIGNCSLGEREAIFAAEHRRLLLAATALLTCDECAAGLLEEVHEEFQNAYICRGFEYAFALRSIARRAIVHLQRLPGTLSGVMKCDHSDRIQGKESHLGNLPWPERAAYFLREILGYSRRDASLLIGMSDTIVDQFLLFGRKRIAVDEGASPALLTEWYQRQLTEGTTYSKTRN